MPVTNQSAIRIAIDTRDQKIERAREAFQAAVHEANAELAETIRSEREHTSMTKLAGDAGLTRQTLHEILRRAAAAA